jgi:hypothetical protein
MVALAVMDTSEAAGRGFLPSSSVAAMDGNCGKLVGVNRF